MTTSTTRIAETLLADPAAGYRQQHLSLMHGWLPLTVQAVAVVVLLAAIGWRNRRWRLVWLPVAAGIGAVLAATAYWYISSEGLAGDPAPKLLWIWIAAGGHLGRRAGDRLARCAVVAAQLSAVVALPLCTPVRGVLP